jgi:uncharacterized protein YaeQ
MALKAIIHKAQIQVTVQDGSIWVGEGARSVEVTPVRLLGGV